MKTKFSTKGITLIEAMVAVFVLTIGIIGVLSMFLIATQTIHFARMTSVAIHLAQAKMEEIVSRPYIDIISAPRRSLEPPFNAYSREVVVTCFDPNELTILPNCPETGIRRIEVMVFWRSPLGVDERSVNVINLISRR